MVLVDTSVWIDHLRNDNDRLRELLDAAEVLVHPFIVGALALPSMRRLVVSPVCSTSGELGIGAPAR